MNYNYTVINKETEEQVGGDFTTIMQHMSTQIV